MTKDNLLPSAAVAYAERGYRVFPVKEREKAPASKNGVHDATSDVETVMRWWRQNPFYNIGLASGQGVLVLDIDGPEGLEALREFEDSFAKLPATPFQATGKGVHYFFKCDDPELCRNSASKVGPKIDTRGDGGYVIVAPSVHPSGRVYKWDEECRLSRMDLAPAPDWLLERLKPKISEQAAPTGPTPDMKVGDKYLDAAIEGELEAMKNAPKGSRNETINKSAFNLGTLVGAGLLSESEARKIVHEGASLCGWLQEEGELTVRKVANSGIRAGMANPRQVPQQRVHERQRRTADGKSQNLKVVETPPTDGTGATVFSIEPEFTWSIDDRRDELCFTADGGLRRKSLQNVMIHLRHRSDLEGLFAYNEFSCQVELTRRPPWAGDRYEDHKHTNENDLVELMAYLEKFGMEINISQLTKAVRAVAEEFRFNHARERLESLVWDGSPRLDHYLVENFGASDTSFVRQAGAKWLISAVARIMKPGCKADCMLVLEGKQGIRKSSALRALADAIDEGAFTDRLSDLKSKDAITEILGCSIVEIAELDALRGAAASTVKAFLSRDTDKARLPFDRLATQIPRTCVFAGTVNPGGAGWLHDATGARRFWPIACGDSINLVQLRGDAEQLWAEAAHRFGEGEEWWITDPVVLAEAEQETSDRYEEDAWGEIINEWIDEHNSTRLTGKEILKEIIGMQRDKWEHKHFYRIGAHMRRIGWEHKPFRVGSGNRLVKGYVKPDSITTFLDDE